MRPVADERTAVAGALATLLAAWTLSPLVDGITWLVVAGVIVVTVMVSGIIARHLLNRPVLVAAVQFVVLLVTLEVLFARSRLLDGPGAVTALTDLLRAGLQVTRDQPPPVEASQGVILLAAGGAGIVGLLVDVLACSLRQPALAGLPLLAMYCVPAALLPNGLPWYYFAGAAAGFMLLLAADAGERVQAWGRVLSSRPQRRFGSGDGLTGLGDGGRRAGMAAVIAAVLIPAFMPGLGNQIVGGSGSGEGRGRGSGTSISRINPILDLRKDLLSGEDTNIIWYQTNVPDPQPLRIVTADTFNGQQWAPNTTRISLQNRAQDGLPSPQGLGNNISAQPRTTRIKIGPLTQTYLPLPYPATKVHASGEWLYDPSTLNVIGRGVTTLNQSYTVEHLDVEPTAEQLASAPAPSANLNPIYLSLPDRMPSIILSTAQAVAKNGTPYQQAIRLQRWLRDTGGFRYSTDAPGSGRDDSSSDSIAEFLKAKRGYCVHFASAMAVMARTLKIPSRVAIGFLPGERLADGRMVISIHDAHAWPELYFEGVGWVRFEPTPRAGETTTPQWAIPPSGVLPEDPLPSASADLTPSADASRTPRGRPTAAADNANGQTDTGFSVPWRLVLVVLVLAGLALAPWLTARVSSARRWRAASTPAARAEAAWEELRLGLQDLGAIWAWTWTPRAVQERIGAEYDLGDAGSSALARLVAAIESARYAPHGGANATVEAGFSADLGDGAHLGDGADRSGVPGGLRGDVQTVLARVASAMPRGRRWRARWAPPSAGAMLSSWLTLHRGIGAGGADLDSIESIAASGKDTIASATRDRTTV